ncbi:nucleotidyltransferase-like protein [Alkalicoccus daliensis]|uniref:Nucleotidyltransferase-like n=1 Tax=Alkalicoccus daliensis TaxID=745820 RepID=A0A1H0DLG4_9BACI|nr:nucleotidyltransferase-like protein [Alkalicoccus daliensis]SDN70923.1 Nucleotidyltransferase-like [Alkalicoccus daliensis]
MDEFMRELYQDRTGDPDTLAVIVVKKSALEDAATDYFDGILLVIKNERSKNWEIKHYEYKDQKAAMHIVNTTQIQQWLSQSTNRRAVNWLMNGKVIFDRNEYMKNFKERLIHFPENERQIRIGMEFSKLVRRFADGKSLYYEGHYLDSFNQIVHALHHLARLAVIERGYYPEVTVWQQVKQVEPEIHKLYSELVTGREPIEKRLELLLLANEFELATKLKLGSAHLLSIMEEKEEAWSVEELKERVSFHDYSLDLSMLLEFLVKKGLVDIKLEETRGKTINHRKYFVNKFMQHAAL